MKGLLTIKEVAEYIDTLTDNNISIQTIEQCCKQLSIRFKYRNNERYLHMDDMKIIKQRCVQGEQLNDIIIQSPIPTNDVEAELRNQIAQLQSQLKVKDEQIASLINKLS